MSEKKLSVEFLKSTIEEAGAKWQVAVTSVSELSSDEQRRMLGFLPTTQELELASRFGLDKPVARGRRRAREDTHFSDAPSAGLPSTFDWRNANGADWTSPVRNQGGCGSCVAHGTLAALEALLRIRTFRDSSKSMDLSEAHLLFCGGGSCGGWHMDHACNYLKNNGVPDEACFPYQPRNMPCSNTCADWQNRIDHTKILNWANTKNAVDMKSNIVNNGPQITGMAVYQDFFNYAGGIYEHVTGALAGYHCISVVGYDDANQCWICSNSWGTGWGEAEPLPPNDRGWFRIKYGQCGIEDVFGMWNMIVPVIPPSQPCLKYRTEAARYLALYRRTLNVRYKCLYFRYIAAYYCCMYRRTRNPIHLYLCRKYTAAYRRCALRSVTLLPEEELLVPPVEEEPQMLLAEEELTMPLPEEEELELPTEEEQLMPSSEEELPATAKPRARIIIWVL